MENMFVFKETVNYLSFNALRETWGVKCRNFPGKEKNKN
jgi:hypothetical protein